MEIIDYLRIARRRLWVLVGVPVLAAVLAAAIVLLSPRQYSSTAYIAAPALVGGSSAAQQFTGTRADDVFAANLQASATSPQVVNEVAKDTHVSTGTITGGLHVTQVGASGQVTITYTSTNKNSVGLVIHALTSRTLAFMFSSQVTIGRVQVATAQGDVQSASGAISAWQTVNGVAQPDVQYQATLNQITNLQNALANATADPFATAADNAAMAAAQKKLAFLGPKLPAYGALQARQSAAATTLSNAQQQLQSALAQQSAADPKLVANISSTAPGLRATRLVKTVLPVTAAALLLAIVLVVVLETLSRSRVATAARKRDELPAEDAEDPKKTEKAQAAKDTGRAPDFADGVVDPKSAPATPREAPVRG